MAAADKMNEERLHRRGIVGRASNDGQRGLVSLAVDSHGGSQRQLLVAVQAVDLD
jgi:hypothetical protein